MVNGVRGLCNGLGPALFGFIFYLFKVNLDSSLVSTSIKTRSNLTTINTNANSIYSSMLSRDLPGPPFLFGAFLCTIALMFSLLLPNSKSDLNGNENDSRINEQETRLIDIDDNPDDNIQRD